MFIKLKKGFQKYLILQAIKKAGSERKLSLKLGIPNSTIYFYKFEKRNFTDIRFTNICNFLDIPLDKINKKILVYLPNNWGKIKGGKQSIKSQRIRGVFNSNIKKLKKLSSKRMKEWHKMMKENFTEEYYKLQYKRFRKIGNKPLLKTKANIMVRNKFEKEVVDFLFNKNLKFEYEPYLNINNKAYFPDLVVNGNIIIEVTAWKHPDLLRITYLKRKIKDYKKKGYSVYFYIPLRYRNFYKEIDKFVISDLELIPNLMPR